MNRLTEIGAVEMARTAKVSPERPGQVTVRDEGSRLRRQDQKHFPPCCCLYRANRTDKTSGLDFGRAQMRWCPRGRRPFSAEQLQRRNDLGDLHRCTDRSPLVTFGR